MCIMSHVIFYGDDVKSHLCFRNSDFIYTSARRVFVRFACLGQYVNPTGVKLAALLYIKSQKVVCVTKKMSVLTNELKAKFKLSWVCSLYVQIFFMFYKICYLWIDEILVKPTEVLWNCLIFYSQVLPLQILSKSTAHVQTYGSALLCWRAWKLKHRRNRAHANVLQHLHTRTDWCD